MTHKRYIIHPGIVYSEIDGDLHYIDAHRLIQLYRLNSKKDKIIVVRDTDHAAFVPRDGDVNLYPQIRGTKYNIIK